MGQPATKKLNLRQQLIRLALWPVIAGFLMIPAIRRWRRRVGWQWVRVAVGLAGIALLVAAWSVHAAVAVAGAVLALLATILGRLEDPERMQKLAERLGARHAVNGGCLASGDAALLFLTDAELLVAPAADPERIADRIPLAAIEAIEVDGAEFRPVYVTFAKAPPQRGEAADRDATSRLTLRTPAGALELQYTGVFARHLAEIAARTIHDCRHQAQRGILQPLPVINQSA